MSGRGLLLGADVGGTSVKFVVTDAHGARVAAGRVPTDDDDAGATLAALAEAVAGAAGDGIAAMGLACAGVVDPVAGSLGRAPNLPGWQGENLRALARAAFGAVPCALANDVNAALMGEQRFGAARGKRDVVMYALGTGVGGGVMVDGRLIVGRHCGAGELGHVVIDPGGPMCGCGNRGCVEAFVGAVALAAEVRRHGAATRHDPEMQALLGESDDHLPRALAELAGRGHADAVAIYRDAGRRLGRAVGGVVNTLDPELVVIGGGVAQAGDLILEPCREEAARVILGEASKAVPIVPAELGPEAAALGAAALAREEVAGT
ncbi:MAG TPA: ROK family protein [Candidatus Krumholzibacteria bacterium]|nr:ROK family protein [Candidatus Krumholzibacteria bacterium]HRX51557.1 ROK family protein [Candidatus Krumholzibacteria bacterium]